MRGKNILTIVVSVVIALIFCMPGQIIAKDEVAQPLAPPLPFTAYGQVYVDGALLVAPQHTLLSLINDTVFGDFLVVADGWYSIDTQGDWTETPDFREGGGNGDLVYYQLIKNDGVPGRKLMLAEETFTFDSGNFVDTDLHFSSTGSPWPVKISSVTPNPTSGNDCVTLCNPGDDTASLDDWKLRDRDGWEIPLFGNISSMGEITVDLGGDILSNAVDGGPSSGDEISLCWQDPLGIYGDGEWVALDLVEYGHQDDYWDNSSQWDYPLTPAEGFKIVRTPELYTDNDNCTTDFTVEEAPEPADTVDIPLEMGWNLISLPLIPLDTSIENVISSIAGQYSSVRTYDAWDVSDPWKKYRPGAAANDLTNLDHAMGIWIKADNICLLTIEGTLPDITNITLRTGWNLVGYPSTMAKTVSTALTGTGFDRPVEELDRLAPYLLRQKANSELMTSGNGYWIHVPSDTVMIVDNEVPIPIPYVVFGFIQLYDGTSVGGYSPLTSSGGATLDVEWYNPSIAGWDSMVVPVEATGQFSADLPDSQDGGIIYLNATFDAPYSNNGYNFTIIDQMMGFSMQNVVCGVPYALMIPSPPILVTSGVPWMVNYEIQDRDHMIAQGYFTHIDGPLEFRSTDPLFMPPPPRIFEGTMDIMPGVGFESLTLYTFDSQLVEVYEMFENGYLTPWYDFYIDPYNTLPGWNTDVGGIWAEVM